MHCLDVDALVTSLEHLDVFDLVKGPICLLLLTDDIGFYLADDPSLLVKDH